jgi:hypothetical protein
MNRRQFFTMLTADLMMLGRLAGATDSAARAGKFASGGVVPIGKLGTIGEIGPEMVLPANSPFVIAIRQGRSIVHSKMLGGGYAN